MTVWIILNKTCFHLFFSLSLSKQTNITMYIANPIYDVFFKYLMEDTDLAKVLIGAIIEEDIVELTLAPQELTISSQKHYLSVVRMDFKAVIRNQTGALKTVLIELQKGKVAFDIARFRRYLAKNYERKEKTTDRHGNIIESSVPIIAIYFLGFELETIKVPVLKATHQYYDVLGRRGIVGKDSFVEQLIHDCFVVQIPHLPTQTQTKLEKILSIFNQQYSITNDHRMLDIPASMAQDVDIQAFISRLGKPLQDYQMLEQAQAEDELETTLDDMQRKLTQQQDAIVEKDNVITEKDKMIAELQKQLNTIQNK